LTPAFAILLLIRAQIIDFENVQEKLQYTGMPPPSPPENREYQTMPVDKINNVNIFWELNGNNGDPLILVHGSWGDHQAWDLVTGELSKTFRVITYDRRGHSKSERLQSQGYVDEDIEDLVGLTEHLDLGPAHIAGNSFGASIVLKTAAKHPGIFKSMIAHEAPLIDLLKDKPQAYEILKIVNERIGTVMGLISEGNTEKATEEFMEKIAMGRGSWEKLPEEVQNTFINNAATWFDEINDANAFRIELETLSIFKKPTLLSEGSVSPPFFPLVIDQVMTAIPQARRMTIEGAGHVPQMTHPIQYIDMVRRFCTASDVE